MAAITSTAFDLLPTLMAGQPTSVFIEDIQEFQPTPIHCLIKLKVNHPYVVWVLGSQPLVGAV